MKKWGKRLLYPGLPWAILIVLLGGIALAVTFTRSLESTAFGYISYALSTYALVIVIASLVRAGKAVGRRADTIPLVGRYRNERGFRARLKLSRSLLINLAYALFKLICAVVYSSFWNGALAGYYILLCGVRGYLIIRLPKQEAAADALHEARTYRTAGLFLLGIDVLLGTVAYFIVQKGQNYYYPGYLIYAMAAYAFYMLIVSAVKLGRRTDPRGGTLGAAKIVDLSCALVAMLSLETAMLATFGNGDIAFRQTMTSITAISVCAAVFLLAVWMIVSAQRRLRNLAQSE